MMKIIFLVNRRSGWDVDRFSRYWRETHAPIAARIPGLRGYVQNHARSGPDGTAPPYDAIAEMWFDSKDAMQIALGTPEGQRAAADAATFMDVEQMQMLFVNEVTVV